MGYLDLLLNMKFALLAAVSALDFEMDLFQPSSFVQTMMTAVKQPDQMKQALYGTAVADQGPPGVVTWAQCSDDLGIFTFDASSTSYTPDPIKKGTNVSLDMHGIVSSAVDVAKIHVHCDWNKAPVYNKDLPGGHYDSSVEVKATWAVPAYAPSGLYSVTINGYDANNKSAMCINAQFNL